MSYKTLTPNQIGSLLFSLSTRRIPWTAARIWLACWEMTAIREAVVRQRRQRRDRRVLTPDYTREEIETLTGLSRRMVTRGLGQLQKAGLLEFESQSISFLTEALPEAADTVEDLAGSRSTRRPIPVPRTVLRFLAQQPAAALGRVMLGYVARGLTLDRKGGAIRTAGTVKASWLSDLLGLSQRAVRYAQKELKRLGWICPDRASTQWKLNRTGAWFAIRLDWAPGVAPLKVEIGTPAAPPREDRKTPSEDQNQKLVFSGRSESEPDLNRIQPSDLHDRGRLRVLFRQAVQRGWLRHCQSDALNFLAAAVRARSTPARDPVRVFVSLVRNRRWNHITQAQEDLARRTLRAAEKTGSEPVTAIGGVLKWLCAGGGKICRGTTTEETGI
jgi:DNA-binding transcriptional ArsR family regulator